MSELDHIRFSVVPSEELTAAQHREIDSLAVHSLQRDFPERPPAEIAYLAAASSKHRHDPNGAVGGSHLAAGQRYDKAISVQAYDNEHDRLLAQVPFANNASSSWREPLDRLAIWGKLHVPLERIIEARWRWMGLAILSKDARAMIASTPPDEATLLDGIIAAGLQAARPHQPVSAYPYFEEKLWKQGLHRAGLSHRRPALDRGFVDAFGPAAAQVYQETWRADTVNLVRQRMKAKKGLERLLRQGSTFSHD